MDNNILSALKAIDVSKVTRAEWIAVGMALKEEGYTCSVWDDWSKNDTRYKPGECERKWAGFNGNGTPVKGGTIVQMAKDRGWTPFSGNACMEWSDVIEYDGEGNSSSPDTWDPASELIAYLEILFDPDDKVGYVANDVWQDPDGKWMPGRGAYDRTAGELIAAIRKHPDDIGAAIGDWKEEAGAWIRFNPVDGTGVKNENVTKFKFALVESDTLPVPEQDALFRKLQLPIAALVHSGGKSLHAIVRVDAENHEEYRKRVDFLYDFLGKQGVSIDRQNRNPSRLSRMPGITRNGNRQRLVATNIGRKSWVDWLDYVEGVTDELPDMETLSAYRDAAPELPEELIGGILRRGHKMLISGSSKAGKSFLLMELCVAIAEGREWLSFKCKKGRVLYVNLEIDPASAINRFIKIYEALGIPKNGLDDIVIWNLRGFAVPLDQLVPKLVRRVRDMKLDAIVIDPIYKVITGDENNASEMGAFCNQFDKICAHTGCASIYCHHHSKGSQGMKKAMDRASGSGVFARDPDAQLDIIQLELSDDLENNVRDGNATAWRLESSLREFPNIKPVNFWFEYPVHRVDITGELERAYAEGSAMANLSKSRKYTTPEERKAAVESAYRACSSEVPVPLKAMADYMGVSSRCARDRIKEFDDEYEIKGGYMRKLENTEIG
nr:MAG TPA: Regulatory protein repA [Caudoviricetes sp.]